MAIGWNCEQQPQSSEKKGSSSTYARMVIIHPWIVYSNAAAAMFLIIKVLATTFIKRTTPLQTGMYQACNDFWFGIDRPLGQVVNSYRTIIYSNSIWGSVLCHLCEFLFVFGCFQAKNTFFLFKNPVKQMHSIRD
jgi:hypothetical protein